MLDSLAPTLLPEASVPRTRPARLRALLDSTELAFLMEAHSGLSAKIVEEAGFAGIWASGLAVSAALGVRDNNEASWTQILDVLEFMADATTLPILVDGDTGYGNFNNVRRLVRKLGERGIGGVCLEDKLFPKTNSFLGERQELADTAEFCGRIRAGKDAQTDPAFSIVARTEALISGHSMDETLRRAEAYHAAGADAVLVHSKRKDASEIMGFMASWDRRCPVVIVPTMYYAEPTESFRQAGISTIIWANHLVRASISAMRETARALASTQSLTDVEDRLTSVQEIFRLTGNDELEAASQRYLPVSRSVHGVVLAASRGAALGALTDALPKCMVDVRGKPLLHRLLGTLNEGGVADVTVVRGYCKDTIRPDGFSVADNDDHETTGEAASLARAMPRVQGEAVVVYGDVLFRRSILDALLDSVAHVTIVVDARKRPNAHGRDLVTADRPDANSYLDDVPVQLLGMAASPEMAMGEWIGLMHLSAEGTERVREELAAMQDEGLLAQADLPALLHRLIARGGVAVHYTNGHWLDVDTLTDLAAARDFS